MTRPDRDTLRKHYMEREHETLKRHPDAEILLSPVYDTDTFEEAIETALIAQTVGDLLKIAREQRGQSQRAVAAALSLAPSRIHALEHSDNLEIATLAQAARTLGYRLVLRLEPEDDRLPSVVYGKSVARPSDETTLVNPSTPRNF